MHNEQIGLSKKKIFLTIGLFLLILTTFRIGWLLYYEPGEQPLAKNGVLDLSDWDFDGDKTLQLDGEWHFVPNEFVDAKTIQPKETNDTDFIQVPGDWKEKMGDNQLGYGTYYLNVILPSNKDKLLGINVKNISVAANMYINGQLIYKHGTVGTNKADTIGTFGPFSESVYTDDEELLIVFHVANFDTLLGGGITESIQFGQDKAITKKATQSIVFQLVVAVIYLFHAMYAFALYLMGKGKYGKEIFFFAFILLLNAISVLIDDDMVIQLPVGYLVYKKILFILFLGTLLSLVSFIRHLFNIQTKVYNWLIRLFILSIIFVLFATTSTVFAVAAMILLLYITAIIFLFYHGVKVTHVGFQDAILVLLFIATYTSNVIWGFGIQLDLLSIPFYPIDFFISMVVVALLLIRRHHHVIELNQIQKLELQKVDKARDEFLANTSHELRNPLHGIINIAESVLEQEDKQLSKSSKESLHLLISVGKRMSYTLTDLSTITQLRENKLYISPAIVDVNIVTTFVIDMLEFMKEGKEIELISQVPTNFPKVWADEHRLVQILFNLVHNAIKYTDYGSIQVIAEAKEDQAVIYVKDTGIGIDTHQMENLFNPYEQVSPTKSIESGSGIGLSVSRQLVELHGGEITFESSEKGTTFIFSIPLSAEQQVIETNSNHNSVAKTQDTDIIDSVTKVTQHYVQPVDMNTILIVDDDPVNVQVLEQLLHREYHIITSLDPKAALEMITLHQIDIIISDVMMPRMSGYEFTQQVREKHSLLDLPILLITARSSPEDVKVSFESGANDYLVKPVDALELRVRVKGLINLKHYIKESRKFEAAWLQAQIQPHFLYNTLNSIASLAEIDTDKMVDILHAFGDYLQRSFSIINLEPTIPVKHAIELTKSYVTIEKARFGDRLQMVYEIDDNIDVMIPPLSIQPLVENAITHGVLQKVEGGKVTLRIKDYSTYTEITISDNGVGMSEGKIRQILDIKISLDDGVGVKNTRRRLLHLYNEELKIESELGKGTTMSFRIPKEG